MASITKRRRNDGGTSWDAMIRVRGYPTRCRTFRTRLEAQNWAARTEAAAYGRTLILGRDVTLAQLIDEAGPKLRRPVGAALLYWRAYLGDLRLADITPMLVAVTATSSWAANPRPRPQDHAAAQGGHGTLLPLVPVGRVHDRGQGSALVRKQPGCPGDAAVGIDGTHTLLDRRGAQSAARGLPRVGGAGAVRARAVRADHRRPARRALRPALVRRRHGAPLGDLPEDQERRRARRAARAGARGAAQ